MAIGSVPTKRICIVNSAVSDKFKHVDAPVAQIKERYQLPDEYILTLSTIEPRKDIPLLIEAYWNLQKTMKVPDLVLVGRKGWMMDEFLDGIKEEVKAHLHFTGFAQDEDLPAIYSGALFYVFPTKYEGFGLPPLEAMACGTPVISSDAASMPEVLGNAAIYFHSGDVQDLMEKMRGLLTIERDARALMIAQGIAQAKKYTWEAAAAALDKALHS